MDTSPLRTLINITWIIDLCRKTAVVYVVFGGNRDSDLITPSTTYSNELYRRSKALEYKILRIRISIG